MHCRDKALLIASAAIACLWGPALLHAQSSPSDGRTATQSGTTAANPCPKYGCNDDAAAQSDASKPAKPYDWKASFAEYKVGKVPRLADGKPDLQGIWSRTTLVPLERPRGASDKIDEAAARHAEDEAQQKQFDLRTEPTDTPPGEKTTDAYNTFWRDGYWFKVPMTSLRTSQVVDPPDGRLPPSTPAAREQGRIAQVLDNRRAMSYEDRPLGSRCIRTSRGGFTGGGPGGQESTFEIVQGYDAVIVRVEVSVVTQQIFLDGRPLPPANVHLAEGASRGHWDGDTLVVETSNFTDPRKHLTERWKRLDDTHLLYGFTDVDPAARTKPYSVEVVFWRLPDQEQLVEYACHEGNVGLEFTLSAARAKDREDAAEAAEEAKGNSK